MAAHFLSILKVLYSTPAPKKKNQGVVVYLCNLNTGGRQGVRQFKANLSYIVRPGLKNSNKNLKVPSFALESSISDISSIFFLIEEDERPQLYHNQIPAFRADTSKGAWN